MKRLIFGASGTLTILALAFLFGATPTAASAQSCGIRYMKSDTGWCNQVCCTHCHCCKDDLPIC